MKNFYNILSIVSVLAGVAGGMYVGLYLMLFCGIIQIVEGCKMDPVSSYDIAFGIFRFLFSGIGWFVFMIGVFFGKMFISLAEEADRRSRSRFRL